MRFSGKNSGNRVRFVRRVSTSVSAKSVLAVTEATTFAPSRCVMSRLGWNSPSTSADGAGTPPPVVTAGRIVRPRPRLNSWQFGEEPGAARLRHLKLPRGKRPTIGFEACAGSAAGR